jgi:cell wall assembly regulator SMI1
MFILRPERRNAAPVARSWQRLEAWFKANAPEVINALRPGCTVDEIAAFEKEAQIALPDEVRESFRIHNGQNDIYPGAVLGNPLDPLEQLSSDLGGWRSLYDSEEASDQDSGLGERSTSYPPDAIRCQFANPNWIPLGDWDSNCYGIDLDPGPNGLKGQIINFGKDEDDKCVLALSWANLLEDIADELEAGNVTVTRNELGEIEHFGRRGYEDQAFHNFYKEWSSSKLPNAFQGAKLVPKKPLVPGEPITNETSKRARQIVEQFVSEMHAYETKWLKIRPIHELGYKLVQESATGFMTHGLEQAARYASDDELELDKHRLAATKEKQAIFRKYGTPRARAMADTFIQVYPLAYDPNRDRVAEVRLVSPDYLVVYMQPEEVVTMRYHLRRDGDKWLIDLKDQTKDGLSFTKVSL